MLMGMGMGMLVVFSEEVVEAAPLFPEEDELDDGPASVGAGARANESESMD